MVLMVFLDQEETLAQHARQHLIILPVFYWSNIVSPKKFLNVMLDMSKFGMGIH
jgi:hypothetical protein